MNTLATVVVWLCITTLALGQYRCPDFGFTTLREQSGGFVDNNPDFLLSYIVEASIPISQCPDNTKQYTLVANSMANEWHADCTSGNLVGDAYQLDVILGDGWHIQFADLSVDGSVSFYDLGCNTFVYVLYKHDPNGNLHQACPCYSRGTCGQEETYFDANNDWCLENLLWQCDMQNCYCNGNC